MGGGPPASWGNFMAYAFVGGVFSCLVLMPIACALDKHDKQGANMNATYYLRENAGKWREVTEKEFVQAERAAGFVPKPGLPQDKPATSAFGGSGNGGTIEGKTRYDLKGALGASFKATEQKQ